MNDLNLYENIPRNDKDFPLRIRHEKRKANPFLHLHWHEHTEILHFVSGHCRFTCGGRQFDVDAGDTVAVNGSELHGFTSDNEIDHMYIIIDPAFFSDVDFGNVILRSHIKADKTISDLIQRILDERSARLPGSDMMIKAYAYELMAYLVRYYTSRKLSEHEMHTRIAGMRRIGAVLDYISEHYSEPLSTSVLCETAYLSESYFCHVFKSETGKSVTGYINELRVEKAAVLLDKTSDSITDIASAVGFEDLNYFSRVFKKIKKVSPRSYRALHA